MMTVKHLREALLYMPDDAPVVMQQGIDYWHLGEVKGPIPGVFSVALESDEYCPANDCCPYCHV